MVKDLTTKRCLSDNERYADLINGAVFGGRQLQAYVNNYPIHVIEVRKFENTDVFRTDLKQIFDFIRFSQDRNELSALVRTDPAFQEMDEAAYDMMTEYANAEGLIEMKKYHGKDGKVNMCKGLEDIMTQKHKEFGHNRGNQRGQSHESKKEFKVDSRSTPERNPRQRCPGSLCAE